MLIDDFHITLSKGFTHGILLGVWPIGGIFGAIINTFVVRYWTKRYITHYLGKYITLLEPSMFYQQD